MLLPFKRRVQRKLLVHVEGGKLVEEGEFGDGDLVRRHGDETFVRLFFLILARLDPARKHHPVPDGHARNEAGVSAPRDGRNVVRLVVRAVDCDKKVGDLAVEGRCAVDGRFADIAREHDGIGVARRRRGEHLAHEHSEHEAGPAALQLVVRAELTERAKPGADRHGLRHEPLGDGDGENVRLTGEAVDLDEQFVKAFAENFV